MSARRVHHFGSDKPWSRESLSPWPATDALGRTLPTAKESGPPRADRFVGIFYFLTHFGGQGNMPNNIAKILAQDPNILGKPDSPLWGPPGEYWWGEPFYGYYNSTDPWVLRRHANLLAEAGIDTLIFDTTNAESYPGGLHDRCVRYSARFAKPVDGRRRLLHGQHEGRGNSTADLQRSLQTRDFTGNFGFSGKANRS